MADILKFTDTPIIDESIEEYEHHEGKFYIESRKAKIKENNIIVGDEEYVGMPGLWDLIVATNPDDKTFTNGDYDNYAEIMHSTNALR